MTINGDDLAYALTQCRYTLTPLDRYRLAIRAMDGTPSGRDARQRLEEYDGRTYATVGDLNEVAASCYAALTDRDRAEDAEDAQQALDWDTMWT